MSVPSKSTDLPRGLIDRKGTPAGRNTRLPSIRGPRDLTLGGIPKKVFMPNIPSRRSKEDTSSTNLKPESQQQSPKLDRHSRHERDRGRGRNRGRDNVVQSHSIFEQGPSGEFLSRNRAPSYSSGDGGGGGGGGGGGSKIYKSSFNKRENKEETKKLLDRLLKDDFIEPCGIDDDSMQPVQLPFTCKLEMKDEKENIGTIPIKTEPSEENMLTDAKTTEIKTEQPFPKHASGKQNTCEQLFSKCMKSEHGELLFLQLPDVLPGVPPNLEDMLNVKMEPGLQASDQNKTNSQSTSEEEVTVPKNPNISSLKDFSEGYVGKLQTRKSGKVQLLLGNVTLDISMGTPCGFLQDLVSVKINGDKGDLTVLGQVNHRLICTPNFDGLVKSS
ncbi:DNA-directed RNA polymerase III subunit RPC4 isoform X2 [Octopus bimaculoides]|uniref:DNA-directed RNA polymerase III subunit RPC4 isoform X2 n=1 Tax=Octopus bimaculoides TaxID=37653 RepID=UPI0022DEC302|nr:DNA-directed RNA polymerase III subunit RPC4 isoform X2 [Octopus bimaculoides]